MTLVVKQIDHDELCHGFEWVVDDIDALAERIARIAMGQYRHVAQVLEGLTVAPPSGKKLQAENALKKLEVAKNGDPWQRDGWIFQMISWIAASQQKQTAILQPPHIFHAHKGFDGMQLELSADGKSIAAIVVFEDKATQDARTTIREQVWPDIVGLEAGERVAELTHETTAMLETQQHVLPELNIDEAIDQILWQEARRYRISITIDDTHSGTDNRKRLFKDFDTLAKGEVVRRRAETMHFADMRAWMAAFALRVADKIKGLADV